MKMKEIKVNKIKESIFYDKCDNGLEIYMYVNEKVNCRFNGCDRDYGITWL